MAGSASVTEPRTMRANPLELIPRQQPLAAEAAPPVLPNHYPMQTAAGELSIAELTAPSRHRDGPGPNTVVTYKEPSSPPTDPAQRYELTDVSRGTIQPIGVARAENGSASIDVSAVLATRN